MPSKLITFLTLEEVQKLLKACPKHFNSKKKANSYQLAIILGFGSGLRLSEVIGGKRLDGSLIPPLTQDMVNLKERQIRIVQGKGRKDRVATTSPWLTKKLVSLLPLKIKRRTLQYNFNKLSERYIGKRCHFHQLRHGFGNYMVNEKNVPITVIQQLMGHSRVDTTGVYAKANPKQAVAKVWEVFE